MASTSRLSPEVVQVLAGHLTQIYGPTVAQSALPDLVSVVQQHRQGGPAGDAGPLSQRDVFLITYPDQLAQTGQLPLRTLHGFLRRRLFGLIGGVHILPFFPSSSDDGFAVMDYLQVDPSFGSWSDIADIATDFKLMVDGVINHISSQSAWYQGFLRGDPRYADYFIAVDPQSDLSSVVRPRALPLLTRAETPAGARSVWTTFSPDQIDLNLANPEVLLEIIKVLLLYVDHGARVIRLDAIAYLWKQLGTKCIHLRQTHQIVKLLRAILDQVAPGTLLISETNVPHADNVSYFGSGDEAHMVYQFPLPPVVLHAFLHQDSTYLTAWAQSLEPPPSGGTFFNFLASHDGIGLNPARGILPDTDIDALADRVKERGGAVSYRSGSVGGQVPYELNINYLDALTPPEEFDGDLQKPVGRFVAAHSIMLSLQGVPAIYFHSLFGSRNDYAGVERTGAPRAINRERLALSKLENELSDDRSLRHFVFNELARLLRLRALHPALSPFAGQQVLNLGRDVFGLIRIPTEDDRALVCLHNVTDNRLEVEAQIANWRADQAVDLLNQQPVSLDQVPLGPYQARWIEFHPTREATM
jgi:glycosidase